MNIEQPRSALAQNRYLIGRYQDGVPIADILIVPEGVGHHFATAIEELSEQEENYEPLLRGFKYFTLLVTFAHPILQAIELNEVLAVLI